MADGAGAPRAGLCLQLSTDADACYCMRHACDVCMLMSPHTHEPRGCESPSGAAESSSSQCEHCAATTHVAWGSVAGGVATVVMVAAVVGGGWRAHQTHRTTGESSSQSRRNCKQALTQPPFSLAPRPMLQPRPPSAPGTRHPPTHLFSKVMVMGRGKSSSNWAVSDHFMPVDDDDNRRREHKGSGALATGGPPHVSRLHACRHAHTPHTHTPTHTLTHSTNQQSTTPKHTNKRGREGGRGRDRQTGRHSHTHT